ncbi:MAG: serine/threonine protein kinase [Polyangiaceae bacterium]|nr:serine/threonine protein kinase [Polyangiaceae bacterium]
MGQPLGMLEKGRVLAGRYELERLLAQGGMGEVWVARHRLLDVSVAVKLMSRKTRTNSTLRARFEREAKVGARLRTPHVVQVLDYDVDDETPFLAMELLEGQDLSAVGKARPRFAFAEAVDLLAQAARGLAAAHEVGIIHRDVKPSNLFLARVSAGQEIVKVLDFGIAKIPDEDKLTRTNVVLGSPAYMSPEQVMAKPIDARSDVWSLGVVAFWMLAGELPFAGPNATAVSERIVKGDRPSLGDLVRGLPEELDDIFERALALDPKERFASTLELAEELTRLDRAYPDVGAGESVQDLPTDRLRPIEADSEPETKTYAVKTERLFRARGDTVRMPLAASRHEPTPRRASLESNRAPAALWLVPLAALVLVIVGLLVLLR